MKILLLFLGCYSDIMVYPCSVEDHKRNLWEVLDTLREDKIYVNFSKCEFGLRQV